MTDIGLRPGTVQSFLDLVLRHRWLVIVVTVVCVSVAGIGLRDLTFDPDSRRFFGETNPERLALEHMEDTYSKANNVLIILAPRDGNVFSREMLTLIGEITEAAWQVPHSSRVNSLVNHQHTYAEGDELIVEDLVGDPATLSDAELARIRDIALTSPDLANLLVSAKGDVTAINVLVTQPENKLEQVPEIAGFVRAIVAEVRDRNPEVDVYLSGGVIADMTFAEAGQRDLLTLVPLMVVLIAIALMIGLRSATATLATGLVILFSVATALGIAGWAGVVLNGATSGTPIIIMTLCVADCVHVLITIRQQRAQGLGKNEAIVESLRINFLPIAITSLTTAVGFATLNFSDSPPLRELGNIVALGMVAGFIYSVTFLPALLTLLPSLRPIPAGGLTLALRRLADFVIARRRPLIPVFAVILVGLVSGAGRIVYDDNFINYFDESFPFRADTDFLQRRLTGLHVLIYSMPSGEDQGVTRPDYLQTLDDFAAWLREQDKVAHISVLSDTMKRLNKNMHGDDPAYYRIPESRELAAQYLLLYELSVPFGHDLNTQIDVAKSETRLVARLVDVSSADIRALAARGEAWLRENASAYAAPATGLSMVYAYLSERNVKSMMGGTFLALVLISFILLFALRSLPIGLMSLVPNLVPAGMAFGLWGYLYGEVNLAVSVVGAMTLGIVVDDTVHFLSKYLRARRELGMDPVAAVRHTIETVGAALVLTSVALVLGFSVLAGSGFAVSSQMGMLSAVTISIALIADLVFLPPLLLLLERKAT